MHRHTQQDYGWCRCAWGFGRAACYGALAGGGLCCLAPGLRLVQVRPDEVKGLYVVGVYARHHHAPQLYTLVMYFSTHTPHPVLIFSAPPQVHRAGRRLRLLPPRPLLRRLLPGATQPAAVAAAAQGRGAALRGRPGACVLAVYYLLAYMRQRRRPAAHSRAWCCALWMTMCVCMCVSCVLQLAHTRTACEACTLPKGAVLLLMN